MGSIDLHGQKTCSGKADQLAKPVNPTVHGWCMSVAISWGIKWNRPSVTFRSFFKIQSQIMIIAA